MADLTRVAEVLAAHHARMDEGGAFDGCACYAVAPWDVPAGVDGYVAHAEHVAQLLADAGLVASETETQFEARARDASSVRLVASAVDVYRRNGWVVYQREVWRSPWRLAIAQPAQIDTETGRQGTRTTSVADDTRAQGSSGLGGM